MAKKMLQIRSFYEKDKVRIQDEVGRHEMWNITKSELPIIEL